MVFMDRQTKQDEFHLPSPAQVKRYLSTLNSKDGPTFDAKNPRKHVLKLDLAGTLANPWNKQCVVLFAKAYIRLTNALSRDFDEVHQIFFDRLFILPYFLSIHLVGQRQAEQGLKFILK